MRKFLAEFIGTFVLVFVACGVACVVGCDTPAGYLATALTFGLVIVAMAYSIGNVSGCHINPAVSIAVLINGGMSIGEFFVYIIAQFAGGIAGAGALMLALGAQEDQKMLFNNCINGCAHGSALRCLAIEALLTFIFVLAVLGATSKIENSSVAGLVIGGSLTLVHLIGIYFTGTSVNPARSFGPALIGGGLNSVWIFIVGPMVGGIVAALVWKLLNSEKKADK